jgi:hypothetical protein
MRNLKYICLLLLTGCAVNPELYRGSLSYGTEPSECEFVGEEVSFEPGVKLNDVQELAERKFKSSAMKAGANFIYINNHSVMHINAKNPKNSGMYYRVEAKLYKCGNA